MKCERCGEEKEVVNVFCQMDKHPVLKDTGFYRIKVCDECFSKLILVLNNFCNKVKGIEPIDPNSFNSDYYLMHDVVYKINELIKAVNKIQSTN